MPARRPRILIAPLDWGLGHTTRCIPIIYEFINQGAEIILAARGLQKNLLEQEFPQLRILPIPGYRVQFSRHRSLFRLRILGQVPKILASMGREHRWLRRQAQVLGLDGVVSDHRYGLHASGLASVVVCHQLQLFTGAGYAVDWAVSSWSRRKLEKFSRCWVPDVEAAPGLAGLLSHPSQLPHLPLRYLGGLSRFRSLAASRREEAGVLALVSGPEPQRGILEARIIRALQECPHPVLVVRGLPSPAPSLPQRVGTVQVVDHLGTEALGERMASADLVIARSGYSTIMDLAQLGKKCILIPTPGQEEQQYLARMLAAQGFCATLRQEDLRWENLRDLWKGQKGFPPQTAADPAALRLAVAEFLSTAMDHR